MVLANFEPEATTAGACRTARLSAAESGADVRRYRHGETSLFLVAPTAATAVERPRQHGIFWRFLILFGGIFFDAFAEKT